MAINYKKLQSLVNKALTELGMAVTISRNDVDVGKTWGCWGKDEDSTQNATVSTDVDTTKIMYLSAKSKVVPQVGDYIIEGDNTYYITNVEHYKPAKTMIGYKVTVA